MRIRLRLNKILLTLILLANSICLLAQQTFIYKADIGKVDTSGFYRISLPPGLLAKSNNDLTDIRILNQNGKFVPYMFGNRLPVKTQQHFIAFPQVNLISKQDTITTFVFENRQRLTINQLELILRNTTVDRMVNLAGSDDLTNWYAIKENILLNKAGEGAYTNGTYGQLLNFPASTYRYFKIQVNNNRKEPVAILMAGVYQTEFVKPIYIKIPDLSFTQKDTGKLSRVFITFDEPYPINQLKLNISGAKYYKRAISIYSIEGKYKIMLADTSITSTNDNGLNVSAKTKVIQLDVLNEDNPPLKISDVSAYQLEQSLVAYLDKGSAYRLIFGDTSATAPAYDLQFFADSLQRNLSLIPVGEVSHNPLYHYKNKTVTAKPHIPTWLIWGAIIAVLALLSLLTLKMTKEVGERKGEE